MFEGTEEEQIEYQRRMLKELITVDGKRLFPDGKVFYPYVKDHHTGIVRNVKSFI